MYDQVCAKFRMLQLEKEQQEVGYMDQLKRWASFLTLSHITYRILADSSCQEWAKTSQMCTIELKPRLLHSPTPPHPHSMKLSMEEMEEDRNNLRYVLSEKKREADRLNEQVHTPPHISRSALGQLVIRILHTVYTHTV